MPHTPPVKGRVVVVFRRVVDPEPLQTEAGVEGRRVVQRHKEKGRTRLGVVKALAPDDNVRRDEKPGGDTDILRVLLNDQRQC